LALFRGREKVAKLPVAAYEATAVPEAGQLRYSVRLESSQLSAGDYTLTALVPAKQGEPSPVIFRRFSIVEPAASAAAQ
jgi:hypothetical protein